MSKFSGTKKVVAEKTELTERTVHFYTDIGLVIPDIENPKGRGTTRIYSFENLVDFHLIKKLTLFGFDLKITKSIMDKIRHPTIRQHFSEDVNQLHSFYLILKNIGEDGFEVSFAGHQDPEQVAEALAKIRGVSAHKAGCRFPLSPQHLENMFVIKLSSIVKQARESITR
jgi:DNA-binding transcriptional MerR regulator